ncbi:hypothetical protein B296_00028950, partial [Ensete ventricosum]
MIGFSFVFQLEKAYDRIMMSQLQSRKKGLAFGSFKVVSKDIKYADKQPIVPWGPSLLLSHCRYSKSSVKDMRINMALSAVFVRSNGKTRTARYIPVRQLTGTWTGRYRAIP